MRVEITQFMRPDGHQVANACEGVNDALRENYEALRKNKCRITAEVLMTEKVSIAIEHELGDYAIELADNFAGGRTPKQALEALLGRFNQESFNFWKQTQIDPED